jgi:hypothetical protein
MKMSERPTIELLKDPQTGDIIPEVWKEINGALGYKISNYGRGMGMRGRILRLPKNRKGYVVFRMPNVAYHFTAHRVVALHFIPNPQNLPIVNHIDGNPSNNFIGNLEWCTTKHNVHHSINMGRRTAKSNLRGNDIFDTIQVKVIKDALRHGIKGRSIADYFNCHESTISKIRVGKHYPNV